jgi:hypothetical protein
MTNVLVALSVVDTVLSTRNQGGCSSPLVPSLPGPNTTQPTTLPCCNAVPRRDQIAPPQFHIVINLQINIRLCRRVLLARSPLQPRLPHLPASPSRLHAAHVPARRRPLPAAPHGLPAPQVSPATPPLTPGSTPTSSGPMSALCVVCVWSDPSFWPRRSPTPCGTGTTRPA